MDTGRKAVERQSNLPGITIENLWSKIRDSTKFKYVFAGENADDDETWSAMEKGR